MCVGMCADVCVGICVGMCVDMCIDMCADMCVGTCLDMLIKLLFCPGQCTNMRVDMCGQPSRMGDGICVLRPVYEHACRHVYRHVGDYSPANLSHAASFFSFAISTKRVAIQSGLAEPC